MRSLFFLLAFWSFLSAADCPQLSNTYPPGFFKNQEDLDPQSQEILKYLNKFPVALRNVPLFMLRLIPSIPLSRSTNPDIEITDKKLGAFSLKIFTPKTGSSTPLPVLVFLHGGGWVLSYTGFYDNFCQEISLGTRCIVVAVDYRTSPEATFPDPLEDCYSAANWVAQNIGDPKRIAIGGDSAGGNLAAAVCLMARDRKQPSFLHQVLICPALNYNFDTLSYFHFAEGYFPTREDMRHFWNVYLGKPENGFNPYASPLRADCLAKLPPASLIITDFDPLRDEGLAYGLRLHREGVATTIRRYNAVHGFYGFGENTLGQEARSFIIEQLRKAFQ